MAVAKLFFDPDEHPDQTLKAFEEFILDFSLRYEALYPDPPKVSLESAIQRWKYKQKGKEPTLEEYDTLVEGWKSKDKVSKFLGVYSSRRLYSDWLNAEKDETTRKNSTWEGFVTKMKLYYKPTANSTLKNFQFRGLSQEKTETFIAFCNRVEREAAHCEFSCSSETCQAGKIAVRDQIIIGLLSEHIREEALMKSWDLPILRVEGMKIESASKSAMEIAGDTESINKLGRYSMKNLRSQEQSKALKKINCYRCGVESDNKSIAQHARNCPAKKVTCNKCQMVGHYEKCCKSVKEVQVADGVEEEDICALAYSVNLFRVKSNVDEVKCDFKVQLLINNSLDKVLADTGARVSVCSLRKAKQWGLISKMTPSTVKIKPYKSKMIPTLGQSRCSVTCGSSSVSVVWHIIEEDCEPVLAGVHAKQLGIIVFNPNQEPFMPINMIKSDNKQGLQEILLEYPKLFQGIGKLKDYKVNLLVDKEIKPVAEPARRMQYHLIDRVNEAVSQMIKNDVIEVHPANEPAPWTSNVVVAHKDDGELRITMDSRNLNKALLSSNFPIPRQEDLKARISGSKVFSKLDLKSAYWQLEIAPESRWLTTFHCNGHLYRYKRLVMGMKCAQGELNAALQPLFAHLQDVHVIHDDIVIGTITDEEHMKTLKEVLTILEDNCLTLNQKKCIIGTDKIKFWGMMFGKDGISPDPEKVEALSYLSSPRDKEELNSFLCMMQANAEFICKFAKEAATLRELTKKNSRFLWKNEHETCFRRLIKLFKDDTLVRYFDCKKRTFVIVDGHRTGLSAILAQGDDIDSALPVAMASRATNSSEKRYPQLDLEAASVDFGLRRFREYLVGDPKEITIVTDHKPLLPVFNGKKKGSIRSQRIKLNHQDVQFRLEHCKGKRNWADFIGRHPKPFSSLPLEQKAEADALNNLLYILHTTPITDQLGLGTIAVATGKDPVLSKVQAYIRDGANKIPKHEDPKVLKFDQILSELMIAGNGVIFKSDRIVLPETLQQKAMELAHRGTHPAQSGLERRLRFHFFFHNMYEKTKKFLEGCESCNIFSDKKTKEPITHHKVPSKNWEKVSVDLYGPMPSSKHVVVVQDLASRYPAAKLVKSTKADAVLPVLEGIYDTYGNPHTQLSDNGPPFNGQKMADMAKRRDVALETIPPTHPNGNPVETFMKPLGKAMKIGNFNKVPEEETLNAAIKTYRQTPHPSTGMPPGNMLFRDGVRDGLPRKVALEEDVIEAREKDVLTKEKSEERINASKYRKSSNFNVGDEVLVKNFRKTKKFDPTYIPDPYKIVEIDDKAKKLV